MGGKSDDHRMRKFVDKLNIAYCNNTDYYQYAVGELKDYVGLAMTDRGGQMLNRLGHRLFSNSQWVLNEFFLLFPWADVEDDQGGDRTEKKCGEKHSVSAEDGSSDWIVAVTREPSIEMDRPDKAVSDEVIADIGVHETSDVNDMTSVVKTGTFRQLTRINTGWMVIQ